LRIVHRLRFPAIVTSISVQLHHGNKQYRTEKARFNRAVAPNCYEQALFMEDGVLARRVRLVVLGRINGLPDNVVVDLFGRLGLRWLGWGYNRGWRRFRLLRRQHRRS
jgi:hypothetical protein